MAHTDTLSAPSTLSNSLKMWQIDPASLRLCLEADGSYVALGHSAYGQVGHRYMEGIIRSAGSVLCIRLCEALPIKIPNVQGFKDVH